MPDLAISLHKHDLGHLRIVAEICGLELESNDAGAAAQELADCLLEPILAGEVIESLAKEARAALEFLVSRDGRVPWAEFARQFGQVREMGAARRDRDKPHLQPQSPAETLFYRGLLDRAFFESGKSLQEFAYIPDDLLVLATETLKSPGPVIKARAAVPQKNTDPTEPMGRPASPGEHGEEEPADDRLLDDVTTLLAAFRMGIDPPATQVPQAVVEALLRAAGLIQDRTPRPEPIKEFLEAPPLEAMQMLMKGWLESETIDELRLVPGLACEGEWTGQPAVTREFLLNLLEALPKGKWWSLPAFIRSVKEHYPDFQRPAGDYDSWFIKRVSDGTYLRGFAHWDQVDGALIHFFITGILHWLGMADLAKARESESLAAFRLTSLTEGPAAKGRLSASSDGMISVPHGFPRAVRYQVSRFGEWEAEKAESYRYRLTPASLKRAGGQGLKVEHLLALLAKHAEGGTPPVLVKALKSWEAHGTEARLQNQVILRVSRPEILEELRKSKAARFLGESLGPTAVVVKGGAQARVLAALTGMGLLAENEISGPSDEAEPPPQRD